MTDYTKLIEALRCKGLSKECDSCGYGFRYCPDSECNDACHVERIIDDAAAAIEELQDKVFELEEELNDADVAADDNGRQIEELAKRNAELHAELERLVSAAEKAGEPKRGEWQKAKPHGVVTYSDGYAECSHCHEAIWLGWGMNFCPNCGTQNKIIDPDDYDWAKMEVQDESISKFADGEWWKEAQE